MYCTRLSLITRKSNFLPLYLILLLFSFSYAQESNKITEISIKGLLTTTEESIKTKLELQVGKPFSSKSLKKDIQKLHTLGIFSNINVQVNQVLGGVKVTFLVSENRLLGEIKIIGNNNIDEDEIYKTLKITKEKYLAPYTLSLDIINLKELYHKKGYQFVEIKTEKKASGGWIDVYIVIDEGPCVTIAEINFFGNKTFSKSTLLALTQTQENGIFSSSYYDEEVLEEDLVLMRNYYRAEGYLDVKIELRDIFYSNDRTTIHVNILVDEGILYKVEKITFTGQKLFTEEEFRARITLKEKMAFKQGDMLKDQNKISRLYGENGFLNAKVSPVLILPYVNKPLVHLTYKIKEGAKTYIRKIDLKGNVLTRDDVIRRDMLVIPGERFNLGKIEYSRQRLNRSQYFESIKMDLNDTEDPSWKDLILTVEEGRTGNLRFAAGITSDLGAVGEVSLTKRNFDITNLPKSFSHFFSGESFTGAGQTMEIFFQAGEDLVRFKVSFIEPYFFGYDILFGMEGYSTARGRESWNEGRSGFSITFGKRIMRDTIIKFIYRFEDARIYNLEDDAPFDTFAVEGNNLMSSATIDFTIDTRDNFILATRGYIIGLSYQLAGVFLGGDHNFSKANIRLAYFQTVYTTEENNKHILSFGARLGMTDNHHNSTFVPLFERFYAGGATSIRGFEFRSIGPHETDPSRDNDPIGGNFMFIGTIEYSIPIYQDVLRFVAFTDIGNVIPKVDLDILDTMRMSVGFGLRLKVPALGPRPFAFDFGFPIRKEDDDDTQVFSFSFGKPF